MIAVYLLKSYHIAGIVLFWVSVVSLLLSSMSSIRSAIVSSVVLVTVIVIWVMCSVLYTVFLFIRISGTPVLWFTRWHPVFFKPLFFLWKFLYGFQLSCLKLFSPLFLQYSYNFLIGITFYQVCNLIINLFKSQFSLISNFLKILIRHVLLFFFCQVLHYFFFFWGFFVIW